MSSRGSMQMYGCSKLLRNSFVTMGISCFVGCVSSPRKPTDSGVVLESGTALSSAERAAQVKKSYSFPAVVHAERFKEIVSAPQALGLGAAQSTGVAEGASLKPAAQELPAFEFLVRSERWNDLLLETQADWNECANSTSSPSPRCREIGRARAVAFVRLGHPESAWKIQESLSEKGSNSEDALVFSGLYLDVGATALCAQLSTAASQWEPVETRRALWALRSKCLRISERVEEARAAVRMGLNEFPNDSALLLESAFVSFGENNLTQGCEILEQLYLKKSRQVAVSYNWAQCLIRRRDADEATKVISAGRQDWPLERAWLILFGELALLSGRQEQARQFGFDYLSGSDLRDPLRLQAERLTRAMGGEK